MPWLGKVKAVLETWYPGQEDGNAIAALLFGDVNPSGQAAADLPEVGRGPADADARAVPRRERRDGIPHSRYSEGLLVGYRWFDAQGIAAAVPVRATASRTRRSATRGLTVGTSGDGRDRDASR